MSCGCRVMLLFTQAATSWVKFRCECSAREQARLDVSRWTLSSGCSSETSAVASV
jgi:hypothetical protein